MIASQTAWRPEGYGGNPLFDDGADHQRRAATAFRVAGALKGHVFDNIGFNLSATYQVNHGEGGAGPDISVNRLQLALRGLGGPGCNPATGTPGAGACSYFNPFANAYQAERANQLVIDGLIHPVVDQVFAFEDTAKAHDLMAQNAHAGKMVINVQAPMEATIEEPRHEGGYEPEQLAV